jgi:hypothetical protein
MTEKLDPEAAQHLVRRIGRCNRRARGARGGAEGRGDPARIAPRLPGAPVLRSETLISAKPMGLHDVVSMR